MHVVVVLGGKLLEGPFELAVERGQVDVVLAEGDDGQEEDLAVDGPGGAEGGIHAGGDGRGTRHGSWTLGRGRGWT